MSTHSYRDLEMKVIEWSQARKIIPRSTPIAQARKTAEESAELVEAATKLKVLADIEKMFAGIAVDEGFAEYKQIALSEFKDAAGDTVVTLINACALADVDLVDCLDGAYNQIKDRRGTLMPNGQFVKE
jgi:NTP pyrophosphatase (non-canonical NTP hydrolase)